MSYLTEYIARVRKWVDDEDLDDETITEWIRDAEERMNNELRTVEQIRGTTPPSTTTVRCCRRIGWSTSTSASRAAGRSTTSRPRLLGPPKSHLARP